MAEKSSWSMRSVCVTIALVSIAVLASGGQWLPDVFEKMQITQFKDLGDKVVPLAVNLLIGALLFSVSYLLYRPTKAALTRTLDTAGASDRGKTMVLRTTQLLYWTITVFVIASLVAPDLLGKLFLGISVFTAALALALKDIAGDLFSGTLLQVTRRFNVGDNIAMIGLDVKGQVVDIGYLSTQIKNADGIQIVPNREMWGKSVKVLKPEPSKIILPPGFVREKPKAPEGDHKETGVAKLLRHFHDEP
ncbi:MAG: mechanosensitive ion channel family protein [Cyanobacteria bacterium SZAS LIN-2]|nr:mechanosensitive ion channel family protein [Cyanobacteria bacterium SZAS LIN-2]